MPLKSGRFSLREWRMEMQWLPWALLNFSISQINFLHNFKFNKKKRTKAFSTIYQHLFNSQIFTLENGHVRVWARCLKGQVSWPTWSAISGARRVLNKHFLVARESKVGKKAAYTGSDGQEARSNPSSCNSPAPARTERLFALLHVADTK